MVMFSLANNFGNIPFIFYIQSFINSNTISTCKINIIKSPIIMYIVSSLDVNVNGFYVIVTQLSHKSMTGWSFI